MTSPELKACPFCGDPMQLWDFATHARHSADAEGCPLRNNVIVLHQWNKRADHKAQPMNAAREVQQ